MRFYAKILLGLGLCNLIVCSGLSICCWIRPGAFAEGTVVNDLGVVIGVFAFFIMLIPTVIYYVLLGEAKREELLSFHPLNIALYVLFSGNLVYRLFFDAQLSVPGSATPAKIATTLALALVLNLTLVTMALNHVKQSRRTQARSE